jgi:penicillin amidase
LKGAKTATGKPFLANDPHLSLTVPSIWLLIHLHNSDTGEFMIGATFPGTPGVTIGRNNYISWGVTNVGADVQDLCITIVIVFFLLIQDIIDEIGDASYWSDGKVLEYTVREEKIDIKGEASVTVYVKETIYGPVINDVYEELPEGPPIALRWTALDAEDTTFVAFNELMHARNFSAFRDALRHYTVPSQNFIYADLEGNIGYQCPGRIPVRASGHSGTRFKQQMT